jgi:hypothetical protein
MDIVVCIKRVPATDAAIKIAADGKSIDPAGVTFELNAYDEFALEQALRIKEQLNAGSVTVHRGSMPMALTPAARSWRAIPARRSSAGASRRCASSQRRVSTWTRRRRHEM